MNYSYYSKTELETLIKMLKPLREQKEIELDLVNDLIDGLETELNAMKC